MEMTGFHRSFCASLLHNVLSSQSLNTGCNRESFFSLNPNAHHGVATFCKVATALPRAAEDGLAGTRTLETTPGAEHPEGICSDFDSKWWWRCVLFLYPSRKALHGRLTAPYNPGVRSSFSYMTSAPRTHTLCSLVPLPLPQVWVLGLRAGASFSSVRAADVL